MNLLKGGHVMNIYLSDELQEFSKQKASEILAELGYDVYTKIGYSHGRDRTKCYAEQLQGLSMADREDLEKLTIMTADVFKKAHDYCDSKEYMDRLEKIGDRFSMPDAVYISQVETSKYNCDMAFVTAYSSFFLMNLELMLMGEKPLDLKQGLQKYTNKKDRQQKIVEIAKNFAYKQFEYNYSMELARMLYEKKMEFMNLYEDYNKQLIAESTPAESGQ